MHGMRPFGALISKEDALARLLAAAPRMARTRELPVADARGRVAAATLRAPVPVPPFDRAMMDGYAVRSADTQPGAQLKIVGDVFAGSAEIVNVGAGEAARIATGAPIPTGADAVVRVEETEEKEGVVTLSRATAAGASIDPRGADIAEGAEVVREGDVLTPARLGLLASVGIGRIEILRRPRVALFASGDELLRPGETPRPGSIYDSNTTSLKAALEMAGGVVDPMPPLADDLLRFQAALREAAKEHELVVVAGGASVGARDLAAQAVEREGKVLFHGVRLKPGKPLLGATVGDTLVIGLPGNPTSALANTYLFALPALRKMAGIPEPPRATRRAPLAEDVAGDPERFLFLPVRIDDEGRAVPTFKGSGALTSMAESDGWIGVPEGASLSAGDAVDVHAW